MEQTETDPQRARELREKFFDSTLKKADQKISLEYHRLLFAEQKRLLKENNGIVTIPVEKREEFFRQAGTNINIGRVDSEKMERDWERATSKNGRHPMGGAKDD
jgi:hypothetical protein